MHVLDEVYNIGFPASRTNTFWQPWVKGYSGEEGVEYVKYFKVLKYMWVSQKLKEGMGH